MTDISMPGTTNVYTCFEIIKKSLLILLYFISQFEFIFQTQYRLFPSDCDLTRMKHLLFSSVFTEICFGHNKILKIHEK